MSFERVAEERIRQAMAEGAFGNLPGRGKPVDLEDYFRAPEELRVGLALLKSANFIPEEVALLKAIADLRERHVTCVGEKQRAQLHREINENVVYFNILMEFRKSAARSVRGRKRASV